MTDRKVVKESWRNFKDSRFKEKAYEKPMQELTKTQKLIYSECNQIAEMLIGKNANYGNSFADPVLIFSKVDPVEGLNIRIDDKLSRIARGQNAGEDAELDLIGYLILKRVLHRLEAKS
jgi:hypothetical protein